MSLRRVSTNIHHLPIDSLGRELFRKGTAAHAQHAAPTPSPSQPSVVLMEKQ